MFKAKPEVTNHLLQGPNDFGYLSRYKKGPP